MRFMRDFIGWSALFVGVLLAAITTVNPRSEFSGTRFPALVLNTRRFKTDLFDSAMKTSPPTAIIIGSSRSMNLPSQLFSSITGERFFNFGVFNATIEDDLAVERYALRNDPNVRDLVVGIDPQSFDGDIPQLTELTHNPRLEGALHGSLNNPISRAVLALRPYLDALTVSYLADVVKSARSAAHPPESAYAFDSEGVLQYPKAERERRDGQYDWPEHFRNCSAVAEQEYAKYDSLATYKRAMLTSLISEATARGIHVILWVPPLHPALATAVGSKPVENANYNRVITYMRSLARPPLVSFPDNVDPARLPSAKGWYDCMHFDGTNARSIATSLASAVRSANGGSAETVAAQ
jgi:hypothetical protein